MAGGGVAGGAWPAEAWRDHRGVLLVDAANVVGSRPTGWWRDRPAAARELAERVRAAADAGRFDGPVVIVLEGAARRGVAEGVRAGVRVVHAGRSGDDTLVELASLAAAAGPAVVVTADRVLRRRVGEVGAGVVGPTWLLRRLDP